MFKSREQQKRVVASFAELELQPDAINTFEILNSAVYSLVALTNGSEESTRQLLSQAGAIAYFDRILSCDSIQKTKPHPDVYALAKKDAIGNIWMVAAHAWDIAGAAHAGLRTAFITQEEKDYLPIYPQPEIIADSLLQAANKIAKTGR